MHFKVDNYGKAFLNNKSKIHLACKAAQQLKVSLHNAKLRRERIN